MFNYFLLILPKSVQEQSRFHNLLRFLLNGALAVGAWLLFYKLFRNQPFVHNWYELGVEWLTQFSLICTKSFLEIFGFQPIIDGKSIYWDGIPGVMLDRGCLGRNLMGLFAGFILIFPGNRISKIWFIPAGLILIFFLNVLRIVALLLTEVYWPEYLDVNHHFIFKIVVYSCIFGLWYWWIKRFGLQQQPREPAR